MSKLIRVTYDIVTPESAADGDTADRGWINEDGVDMETYDDYPAVENAISFLKDEGVCEASSSHFHPGIWYSNEASEDYATGEWETHSFHLYGFTDDEENQIFNAIMRRK